MQSFRWFNTVLYAYGRFFRFAIVGGLCAMANLVFIWFATEKFGLNYLVSIAIAFATINAAGFLLNKHFTFQSSHTPMIRELRQYYVGSITNILLNLAVMFVLVDLLAVHYLVASVLVTVALTIRNFFYHRSETFKVDELP